MASDTSRDRRTASAYGARIARGPMGGDQFTQVHNLVFRDSRLSAKAMGVFGHCSTHEAGWHITAKSIAKGMKDGVDAINAALQELERYHYLIRFRERLDNGQYGEAVYFLTDLPAQLRAMHVTDEDAIAESVQRAFDEWQAQNGRSAPVLENPVLASTSANTDDDPAPVDNSAPEDGSRRSQPERDFPDRAEPVRADRPTKNTNHQHNRNPEHQTGGGARPQTPQRPGGTTTSHRRTTANDVTASAGTGGSEGENQTARVDLAVRPDSPIVDELALLLAVTSNAAGKGITQQAAVTRAFRQLADATSGDDFRRAVDERLIHARPAISRDQARTEVRDDRVRRVLLTAAVNADTAINSRAAGKRPHSPQDATEPASAGDRVPDAGSDDQANAAHEERIRAKYGLERDPLTLATSA